MRNTLTEYLTDRIRMQAYICRRISPDGETVVTASGPDGAIIADLTPLGDEEMGWELSWSTNEPDAVGLKDIYEHFHCREKTWREWRQEVEGRVAVSRARWLEREIERLRADGKGGKAEAPKPEEIQSEENWQSSALQRIEAKLDKLSSAASSTVVREFYTTADLAAALNRAELTVREWCRLGQCDAKKTKPYRGGRMQWMIPHKEKVRLEKEGPAPVGTYRIPSIEN